MSDFRHTSICKFLAHLEKYKKIDVFNLCATPGGPGMAHLAARSKAVKTENHSGNGDRGQHQKMTAMRLEPGTPGSWDSPNQTGGPTGGPRGRCQKSREGDSSYQRWYCLVVMVDVSQVKSLKALIREGSSPR